MNCVNACAADIYSLGIILFALKTGSLPYIEDTLIEGYDLYDLMMNGSDTFWEIHRHIHGDQVDFDEDFRTLFMSMVRPNPNKRITLNGIKKSNWYKGLTYTLEELPEIVQQIVEKADLPK